MCAVVGTAKNCLPDAQLEFVIPEGVNKAEVSIGVYQGIPKSSSLQEDNNGELITSWGNGTGKLLTEDGKFVVKKRGAYCYYVRGYYSVCKLLMLLMPKLTIMRQPLRMEGGKGYETCNLDLKNVPDNYL